MSHITEIIPKEFPRWAQEAFDKGQFFSVTVKKITELQNELNKLKKEVVPPTNMEKQHALINAIDSLECLAELKDTISIKRINLTKGKH